MGFSAKRAKAFVNGRVEFRIFSGDEVVFATKSFMAAVNHAASLQKANPGVDYIMKIEQIEN